MSSIYKIQSLIKIHYYLDLELDPLVGWSDANYKGISKNGSIYLIKISDLNTSLDTVLFQNRLLDFLKSKSLGYSIPGVIHTIIQSTYITLDDGRVLRVLTWLKGEVVSSIKPHSPDLLFDIGTAVGYLSFYLQNYSDPSGHYYHDWDLAHTDWIHQKLDTIEDEEILEAIRYFLDLMPNYDPILNTLRKSITHADINTQNLISSNNDKIGGIIDFGDAVYTHTVNELAVALMYAGLNKTSPLEAMCYVVRGFHKIFPLTAEELTVLYIQISKRLIISIVHSAVQKIENADNTYIFSEDTEKKGLLLEWRQLNLNKILFFFRDACGLLPCEKIEMYHTWRKKNKNAPILNTKIEDYRCIDLSVSSLDLGNHDHYSSSAKMSARLNTLFSFDKGQVGIGGYGEIRPIYSSSHFKTIGNTNVNYRAQHLGVDIWAHMETAIYAPYNGRIFSIKNNDAHLDYGPTIIIEYAINADACFYTLYGHLTMSSLEIHNIGDTIKAGDRIGFIGDSCENGGWPPHLHFQVILDMMDFESDYPGVVLPCEWNIWSSICPDPTDFFKPATIDKKKEIGSIIENRINYLGPNLSLSYDAPIHIVRGQMQHLIDSGGKKYVDMVNNVAHVGHEHPSVVHAGQKQMALLNTNTRYLHPEIIHYAEELLATFPDELDTVYFVNSGSEAIELALRIVKTATGKRDLLAIDGAYHGNTTACIDVSSYKFNGPGGQGKPEHTHIVPTPDTYNGTCGDANGYLRQLEENFVNIDEAQIELAGCITESIMSCGGQILLPKDYLKRLYKLTRERRGLCIADEVQVGFGRCGNHFWAFEEHDVVPDIVTLGKPMGNGHPIGAVIVKKEIANLFNNGMEYFNTYGGNPVSCAIGRAVLRTIKEENLQHKAQEVGNILLHELKQIQKLHMLIGDVRGMGLFLGIELVLDRDKKIPAPDQADYLVERMKHWGFLLSTDGPRHNVIKIKPPLCFNQSNAKGFIHYLTMTLQENYLFNPL